MVSGIRTPPEDWQVSMYIRKLVFLRSDREQDILSHHLYHTSFTVGHRWLHHGDTTGALRMPPKIEGGHFGLRERVDCEAGPPVDSPSTHTPLTLYSPALRVSADKSGVGGGECQVNWMQISVRFIRQSTHCTAGERDPITKTKFSIFDFENQIPHTSRPCISHMVVHLMYGCASHIWLCISHMGVHLIPQYIFYT
jgi:hypothetical protein